MTDDEIRAEITDQIQKTLVSLVAALRAEAAQGGGPVSRLTLRRAADALQKVVKGE